MEDQNSTKIIYYMDDDKMPYLIKLNLPPEKAKLKDFKTSLNGNYKSFKYFFQTVVDDFGVVKEEIMDDEARLPCINGRVVAWLIPVEGSIATSDNKSTHSLNLNDFKQQNDDEPMQMQSNQQRISSLQSVSSTQSSNNENMDTLNRKSHKQPQIYDTLNPRKNTNLNNHKNVPNRQIVTSIKDFNHDDTSTETESLVSAFGEMRMKQNQHRASISSKRGSKHHFSSFNNHGNHHVKPHTKQKLSLDSHQTNRANHGHHLNQHHPHHHHHQQYQQNHHHKHQDSFSDDDDDDDESEILNDDTNFMTHTETTGVAPSVMSSDLDTTTFFDNDDDDGQFSSITAETTNSTISSRRYGQNRNRKRLKHKFQHSNYLKGHNSMYSSTSSLTDSTMSLNIITVTLNLDTVNFLGISIVGQSNKGGEGGIYVGSIMTGGAVALDGRIEPGDMILQVNDVSFENMSNDDAVKVLRETVMKPGPVKLVVAKCWDPNPKGYFTVSKQEPVRPIDPSAWVAHTQAHTGHGSLPGNNNNVNIYQNGGIKSGHHLLSHSISSFGSNSSLTTSIADTTLTNTFNNYNYHGNNVLATTTTTMNGGDSTRFGGNEQLNLTTDTDMETVVRSMAAPDSGLDIRDRNWLKITIPMAFIGSDVVDWLFNHVEGFPDRRDARKYACNLLKYGYIRHAVNKMRFSEQCYYIFGDFNQSTLNSQLNGPNGQTLFTLNEESEADFDSVSEFDRDTLYAPMNFPPPGSYNTNNIYQSHQPKIYSNLNGIGIGGPPPPPSYMSSSSSNATSNSTSTTSNNTTSQTIGTSTSALGVIGQNGSLNSASNGIINSDRGNACQFYYPAPPPQLQLTSFNNTANSTNVSSSSMLFKQNYENDESVNQTGMSQYQHSQFTLENTNVNNTNPPNSMLSQSQFSFTNTNIKNNNSNPNFNNYQQQQQQFQNITNSVYNNSGSSSKYENKSVRSSDNSSSGNGSDVELLSSKINKNQRQQQQQKIQQYKKQETFYKQTTNYYEIGTLQSTSINKNSSKTLKSQEPRSLDKIPSELRSSKQSFTQAMDNPCEFFVDVM